MNSQLLSSIEDVSKYFYASVAISQLESNDLTAETQLEIYISVKEKLEIRRIKERFYNIEFKNPDLEFFRNIYFDYSMESEDKYIYRYINLTTVCVERSFSFLKNLPSDNRRSLKSENIFKFLVPRINK